MSKAQLLPQEHFWDLEGAGGQQRGCPIPGLIQAVTNPRPYILIPQTLQDSCPLPQQDGDVW